ncbi:hypothetical protein [Pseudomonas sp. Fl4BN1]|uniref:hypothetical protein n=1 Tax=Pseudomonas sp. Fl4BN1 TaxID=2697651 RepID=UPI0015B5B391|nr:hypothetical protein [Pseudomonas sp. Fl4BN1]
MALLNFMKSDFYTSYMNDLDKEMPVSIDRETAIHSIIIEVITTSLERSSVSLDDMEWLMSNHRRKTISYAVNKYKAYIEPDGGGENIVNEAPQINFPIGHLIEYFLILNHPERLVEYIKSSKIPSTKKYAKEINGIFLEAQKTIG